MGAPLQVKGVRRAAMSQFLGTHQNRLDAKGRVSVPAPFRAICARTEGDERLTLILRPSHKHRLHRGWPTARFDALAHGWTSSTSSATRTRTWPRRLYADAYPVEADKEGRIVLGDDLVEHAGLTGQVTFMGWATSSRYGTRSCPQRRRARSGARLRS